MDDTSTHADRRIGATGARPNRPTLAAAGVAALLVAALTLVSCGAETAPTEGSVVAADPTPTPVATAAPAPAPDPVAQLVPEDFPLTSGLPESNEDGSPVAMVPAASAEVTTCTVDAPAPLGDTATDAAQARLSQPEDYRSRTLLVYPSVSEARARVTELRERLRDCVGLPGAQRWTEQPSSYDADESAVFTVLYSAFGPEEEFQASVGLSVVELVRVGHAVLALEHHNEGGGSDEAAAQAARRTAREARAVVAAMRDTFAESRA